MDNSTSGMQFRVDNFNASKVVRVSIELYQIEQCRWKLSTLGYRLLFAIAQCVDKDSESLFSDVAFDKSAIFTYLGLSKTGRRHELLSETLKEIMAGGLNVCRVNDKGRKTWDGYAWITHYSFSEDGKSVYIDINPKVKSYLVDLKQYATIQPKTYLRLNTDYQNWFYPYLKLRAKLGFWKTTVDELRTALDLESVPSYSKKNRNSTVNILKNVVGIQISKEAKEENQRASKLKCKPKMIAWDYAKDKEGNSYGTLSAINALTDINVTACVQKKGRSFSEITFFLSEKREKMSEAYRRKIASEVPSPEQDFGKPREVHTRNGERSIADLLNPSQQLILPEEYSNPAHEHAKIPVVRFVSEEELLSMVDTTKDGAFQTAEEVARRMRLKKHPTKGWYKED